MRPPPKNLPGFYYDFERNRYFPIKGPIPRSSSSSSSSRNLPASEKKAQAYHHSMQTKCFRLLNSREVHGSILLSKERRFLFRHEYQKFQASHPVVWKYENTKSVADSALQQLYGVVQTTSGLRGTKLLACGSANGTITLFEAGDNLKNINGLKKFPEPALLSTEVHNQHNFTAGSIWCAEAISTFPSNISSIKMLGDVVADGLSMQNALVTTLGSGGCSGSVYVLNLCEPLDFSVNSSNLHERTSKITSAGTIWTADCSLDGTHAVIGTNSGSFLVNYETRKKHMLYYTMHDVLSLEYVALGRNSILCGLRNGAVLLLDTREKQRSSLSSPTTFRGQNTSRNPRSYSSRISRWPSKDRSQAVRTEYPSSIVSMPSAICSLISLRSDSHYFIASSMDGSLKLFDLRFVCRAIQSYDGHVNTHSHLKAAVNFSETLILSGGEDAAIRMWSIKDGDAVFEEKIPGATFTTVCWAYEPQHATCLPLEPSFERRHSWGAWLGSYDGLFYAHGV